MRGIVLWLGIAATAGAGALVLGCDKDPVPIVPVKIETTTQPTPLAPFRTEAEMLALPTKRMRLGTLPLTLNVPEEWAVEMLGSMSFLKGPTSRSQVQILFTSRDPVTQQKVDLMLSGAKKEMDQDSAAVKLAQLQTRGPLQIMEWQKLGSADSGVPRTLPTDASQMATQNASPRYTWRIDIFAPEKDRLDHYELNFIGLTLEEYEADKALLHRIIDSIEFTAEPLETMPPAPLGTGAHG